MSQNAFERYNLDPLEGPGGITERLRELAEDADEDERAALREAWETLTLHPLGRLRAALAAHPESRAPIGARPRRAGAAASAAGPPKPRPSVAAALGETASPLDVRLMNDAFLAGDTDVR